MKYLKPFLTERDTESDGLKLSSSSATIESERQRFEKNITELETNPWIDNSNMEKIARNMIENGIEIFRKKKLEKEIGEKQKSQIPTIKIELPVEDESPRVEEESLPAGESPPVELDGPSVEDE